jgi:Na+/proline symporter
VLSGGAISLETGIYLGVAIVLSYTLWGGLWSVAFTDLVQSVIILVGLVAIAWLVADLAGGAGRVIAAAAEAGRLEFWPKGGTKEWLAFAAAWATLAIGSIPQQDVFQRVTSAKDEGTAVRGCLLGGAVYFCFAFVPMFIAYAALSIDPGYAGLFANDDSREIQRILPDLILERTPAWAQVIFFGALLSAILSTASGALLAPTALFTENVIRPFARRRMDDRQFLLLLRVVLVAFAVAALAFAIRSKSTMYEMVQNAYKVTMVGALVPLVAGLFWKRSTATGAMSSILAGLGSWLLMEAYVAGWFAAEPPRDVILPAQFVGLAFAAAGMVIGSLASRAPAPAAAQ